MKRTLSLLVGAVALLGMAFAQQTPAGTNISNQASATYIDSAGQNQSTTSNQVLTLVQQVYSFTITPNSASTSEPTGSSGFAQSRPALPGAPVYFPYTVSNTGNGTDRINLTNVPGTADGSATPVRFALPAGTLYKDDNCNGTVDDGEVIITQGSGSTAGILLAQGASACVIVATTIPSGAANTNIGNINLSGSSWNSGGSVTDTNNWSRAIATTAAALDINKSASPSGQVSASSNITYTVSGQNRGGSAASGIAAPGGLSGTGILIADTIPSGLSVTAAPIGSAGAGSVNIVYYDGSTWSTTAPSFPWAGDGSRRVGMWITGSGAFFPQNTSYTFSFVASVPGGTAAGTSYSNTANIQYNNGSDVSTDSNTTNNSVATSRSVALGPNGAPTAAGNGTVGTADEQIVASAFSGQTVIFTQTLRNTGNASDSFTLLLGTGSTTPNLAPPSSWNCQITQTNGTPISGPVGSFASNGEFSFQVRCALPANYTSSSAVSFSVIARSEGNNSVTDPTVNTINEVNLGYGVDLATRGNTSKPETSGNDNPAGQSANPSSSVVFPLDVRNNGENTDSYELSASSPFPVQFYIDTNNNGSYDPGTDLAQSNTGSLAKNAVQTMFAVVTVPSGTAPGSNSLSFTATSNALSTVTNSVSTTVTVNEIRTFSFTPDRNGTVTSPGTITYSHNLRNDGNSSATVSIAVPTFLNTARGWTYQYRVNAGSWTTMYAPAPFTPPAPLSLSLTANGGTATLEVRVIVPAGDAVGTVETAQITATATYSGGSVSATVNDTTTIVAGDLKLDKTGVSYVGTSSAVRSASAANALPGDQIEYSVVATNNGVANLTNVKIADPLPSFTDFVSVSATTTISGGTVLYSTNGTTWSATAPTSLTSGQSIYVGVDTNADGTITATDTMPAGRTITITFRVQVR